MRLHAISTLCREALLLLVVGSLLLFEPASFGRNPAHQPAEAGPSPAVVCFSEWTGDAPYLIDYEKASHNPIDHARGTCAACLATLAPPPQALSATARQILARHKLKPQGAEFGLGHMHAHLPPSHGPPQFG
jgi:hypothetical protein